MPNYLAVPRYFINIKAQRSGDHEVHREGCPYMPKRLHRLYLSRFRRCTSAVKAAKLFYKTADGCHHCCKEGHKS